MLADPGTCDGSGRPENGTSDLTAALAWRDSLIAELRATGAAQAERIANQAARISELERRLGLDRCHEPDRELPLGAIRSRRRQGINIWWQGGRQAAPLADRKEREMIGSSTPSDGETATVHAALEAGGTSWILAAGDPADASRTGLHRLAPLWTRTACWRSWGRRGRGPPPSPAATSA